jgi:hypothetical protein
MSVGVNNGNLLQSSVLTYTGKFILSPEGTLRKKFLLFFNRSENTRLQKSAVAARRSVSRVSSLQSLGARAAHLKAPGKYSGQATQ